MDVLVERPTRQRTPVQSFDEAGRASGPAGNERLTALTAVVLLVLLAVEGATLLSLRSFLSVHVFVGMLLVPPVALKLASTGYRFLRYYAGHRDYVVAGPPAPLMRFLVAPVVIATTLGLFASGIALIAFGPGHPFVVLLHKASFVVWLGAMSVHVLAYVLRLPGLVGADLGARDRVRGRGLRQLLVACALVAGAVLAVMTVHLAHPWHVWMFSFRNDG
jgi:hypothetical protein